MNEVADKEFIHLKIHTQYSICEGALRILDLAKNCPSNICIELIALYLPLGKIETLGADIQKSYKKGGGK